MQAVEPILRELLVEQIFFVEYLKKAKAALSYKNLWYRRLYWIYFFICFEVILSLFVAFFD